MDPHFTYTLRSSVYLYILVYTRARAGARIPLYTRSLHAIQPASNLYRCFRKNLPQVNGFYDQILRSSLIITLAEVERTNIECVRANTCAYVYVCCMSNVECPIKENGGRTLAQSSRETLISSKSPLISCEYRSDHRIHISRR